MSDRYWGIYSDSSGWWLEGKTSSNYDAGWTRVVFYPCLGAARAHLTEIYRRFTGETNKGWREQWRVREFTDSDEE